MAKRLDFNAPRQQEHEQKFNQKCKAQDCPLIWIAPAGKNHEGLCSFHNNTPAEKWPGITHRILENRGLYDTYVRVLHMGAGMFDQKRKMFDHVAIPPEERENGLDYKNRLLSEFRRRVLP